MFKDLNSQRIVQLFCDLVKIDNPSLQEKEMANAIKSYLTELNLTFTEDDTYIKAGGNTGNIHAYCDGAGEFKNLPPILFSAHLDSVNPAVGKKAIIHDDGTITSDGTTVLGADDLAGMVAILEALRYIKEHNLPHRPIELLFTYAEELYDIGSSLFDFSKIKSKEAYVLDSSGIIGSFLYKAPSIISLTFKIHGIAAHAGFNPEAGVHAIKIAAEAISQLTMGKIDEETTVNIGEISGGKGTNIVPALCEVKGEIRSYVHEKALTQVNKINDIFTKTTAKYGGKLEMIQRIGCTAYKTNLESSVVARYKSACVDNNLPFTPQESFGGSDNNHFAVNGIEGIVLACGMNKVHSVEEYVTIDDLLKSTSSIISLMLK